MKTEGKSLAVIGATYMAAIFIDKAKEIGLKTYCFAWEEGAVAKDHADTFYPISVMDKEKITKICKELDVDGVLCTTEAPIESCGYVANQLGLNGNGVDTSTNITNKNWVREKTKICQMIQHPNYMYIKAVDDISMGKEWTLFPAIVKPAKGGGKRGVIVCKNEQQLAECISYSFNCDQKKTGILIEEYIDVGKEYSVESLSFHGKHKVIQITEKISSGPPHCVELGHHQPAGLSDKVRRKVELAISEVLDAVSFINGPTHTEIKISDDRIYLIELNARPGGDHIATTLIPLSSGYDYVGNSIKVAIGEKPETLDENYKKCCGIYFITKQTEFLKPAFDSCENKEWLYEKHLENDDLDELTHNDCTHTNYMIYCSDKRIEL